MMDDKDGSSVASSSPPGVIRQVRPATVTAVLEATFPRPHRPGHAKQGETFLSFLSRGARLFFETCAFLKTLLPFPGLAREEDDSARTSSRERTAFLLVLAAWTTWNFCRVYFGGWGLGMDEAQYWDWSRHLDWSYYSKPPLIAYLIAFTTRVAGNEEWAIRLGSVLLNSGLLVAVYVLTRHIAGSARAGLVAALATLGATIAWVRPLVMSTDSLLVFFWAAGMYAWLRALETRGMRWWLATGLALGLGMLSKYTTGLLVAALALHLLLAGREKLRSPGPWLAGALVLASFLPVLWWNATHDWISFSHHMHLNAPEPLSFGQRLSSLWGFLLSQGLMSSPVLLPLMLWAAYRLMRPPLRGRAAFLVFLTFLLPFGFYVFLAAQRNVYAHWPTPAYLGGAVALGWVWTQQRRGLAMRLLLALGIAIGALTGLAATNTSVLHHGAAAYARAHHTDPPQWLRPGLDTDWSNTFYIGPAMGEVVGRRLNEMREPRPFVFSDVKTLATRLSYYVPGRPRVYCLPYERAANQYDIWGGWEQLVGRDGLFVAQGPRQDAEPLAREFCESGYFQDYEHLESAELERAGTQIAVISLFRMHGFTGKLPVPE